MYDPTSVSLNNDPVLVAQAGFTKEQCTDSQPFFGGGSTPMRPTPTILVVEDDPRIAEVLQIILEDDGYTVRLARDGYEALTTLYSVQPAVILSDILMPGMDGLALCTALQTHPTQYATPIILMSASTEAPTDSGAAAFLSKPFHLATVLTTVARVITQPR